MSFKEGTTVELRTLHAEIVGTITKLLHGHAIVCFKSISGGRRLAVKPSGALVVLGEKDKLEPDWTALNVGDIEAVPLADILPVQEQAKPIPEWITRHLAECWLGEFRDALDGLIEKGTIKQSIEGLLRASDVQFCAAAMPTYAANFDREQLMRQEEQAKAQEARRYVEKVGQLSSR